MTSGAIAPSITQTFPSELWHLARRQHGVVSRRQLLDVGISAEAIRHRLATGRLHPLWREVYAVGRPEVGLRGTWMAAVLTCGPHAVLSHRTAAELWEIRDHKTGSSIDVSVPARADPRRWGIQVHRRANLASRDVTRSGGSR